MISLDQVLLLQNKVETAVDRISTLSARVEQLNAENDALRSKCAELTKALSEKSELVSTLEADQSKIEAGIINALNRLDAVENSILDSAEDAPLSFEAEEKTGDEEPAAGTEEPTDSPAPTAETTEASAPTASEGIEQYAAEENAAEVTEPEYFTESNEKPASEEQNPTAENAPSAEQSEINGQFDIF